MSAWLRPDIEVGQLSDASADAEPRPRDVAARCLADWASGPIRCGAEIVGRWLQAPEAKLVTFHIDEAHRGQALGDDLAVHFDEAGVRLSAPRESRLLAYLIARGWRPDGNRAPDLIVLAPPSRRQDLRPAASIALVDRARSRLLLGRRLTPPWPGYWAFPGGSLEAGETLLEAGLRELREETAIAASPTDILQRTTVTVGSADGRRAYSVTNFALVAPAAAAPRASAELDAEWLGYERAFATRPMAAGTRRVLRLLLRRLAPGRTLC